MEIQNEIEQSNQISNEIVTEKSQNNFLESKIGRAHV